jgi:hypothetical protein
MTDLETGGAPAPENIDANASQPTGATDVAKPTTVSEADSSPAAHPSEKPKPAKTGEQIRIDELTRRLRETERRYERVLRIAEERGQPPPPPPQQPTQVSEQPKGLKDFNFNDVAYREYLFAEAAKYATTVAEQKSREALQQQTAAQRRAAYEARESAFAATVEDFDEVTDLGPDPEHNARWACSEAMADAIYESEEGPALKYYLASNPDVAAKLARLSTVQAVKEMTRIEDRLVSERKKAPPVSQAPPPAPTIEASGEAGARVDPTTAESDSLSDEQWAKLRKKQLQRKRSS